jgi:hypothetical protein
MVGAEAELRLAGLGRVCLLLCASERAVERCAFDACVFGDLAHGEAGGTTTLDRGC